MDSSKPNQPVPGEFYLLMPDTTRRGRGHGVEIENEDALLTPPRLIIRPEEGGFLIWRRDRAWFSIQSWGIHRRTSKEE